jgi:hypothetical protein
MVQPRSRIRVGRRGSITVPGTVLPPADPDGIDVRLYLSPRAVAVLIVVLTLIGRLIEALITVCITALS